jgi:hypothetical protein
MAVVRKLSNVDMTEINRDAYQQYAGVYVHNNIKPIDCDVDTLY